MSLSKFDQPSIDALNSELKKISNRGIGAIGSLIGTLFGITTGYIHLFGFKGAGFTMVDNQFLKNNPIWPLVFESSKLIFPILFQEAPIPKLPLTNQPEWHLGESVTEKSSIDHFGIQLADYVAYTTSHKIQDLRDMACKHAVVDLQELSQFFNYPGITFGTSYNRYFRQETRRNFQSSKSANRFIFDKTK